jgi:hypothetical protein
MEILLFQNQKEKAGQEKASQKAFILFYLFIFRESFDRGNCNNGGLIVPKSKRGQDKRKPALPRMNLICLG